MTCFTDMPDTLVNLMAPECPAVLIAGTGSGCGKTTITLGLMAAMKARGLLVQPFKCGPDFIDPTLHRMITGCISPNLDMKMCGSRYVKGLFRQKAPEGPDGISIIEGVMGLFDGEEGSGAALASCLGIPVILVVDISSTAESAAAIIKGFEDLDPALNVAAVILNRAGSNRHAAMAAEAARKHCRARVAGMLLRDERIIIPSRHLGLAMGEENPLDASQIEKLAGLVETHVDLEMILSIAAHGRWAGSTEGPHVTERVNADCGCMQRVRIAVAGDEAFCFYYQDNLEMLEAAGAELVEFSPVRDAKPPSGTCGIYFGGGYPELHASRLSANRSMREKTAGLSMQGMPIYAECGGFIYLTESITDIQGNTFPMAGVFPFISKMHKRLRSLGYRTPCLVRDSILGRKGQRLYGHEFHYSDIEETQRGEAGTGIKTVFKVGNRGVEGYMKDNTLAGYIHLHWARTPEAPVRFVNACRHYRQRAQTQ